MITIEAHYSENLTFLLALLTMTPVRLLECSEFFGNFAIDDSFILCVVGLSRYDSDIILAAIVYLSTPSIFVRLLTKIK